MYTQTLCSIVPTQADYAAVKSKFSTLKDTNVSGTLASQIQRMLDNIDTLSGPGSSKKLLDGAGIKASDIAGLAPDDRTRLSEKVTNRYMSAIKEASGDTTGGFADVYGNYRSGAADGGTTVAPNPVGDATAPTHAGVPGGSPGTALGAPDVPPPDASGLVDILLRSVAFGLDAHVGQSASEDSEHSSGRGGSSVPRRA